MDEKTAWTREKAREHIRAARERESAAWLLAEVQAGLALGERGDDWLGDRMLGLELVAPQRELVAAREADRAEVAGDPLAGALWAVADLAAAMDATDRLVAELWRWLKTGR